jgi:endonuclease
VPITLRQNPQHIPEGLDATGSTSQQLRAALARLGWSLQETDTEFRLIPPGANVNSGTILGELLDEPDAPSDDEEKEAYFGLESQLRDFLAQNLNTIPVNGVRLRVYVDPTGRDGVEFPTAVGPIDILAVDERGNFYVFELKRGRTPDYTIGQVTRYMGWVGQTIGKNVKVNGVIVAKQINDNLKYAVCVVPNVSLFEYEVPFQLHAAPAVG